MTTSSNHHGPHVRSGEHLWRTRQQQPDRPHPATLWRLLLPARQRPGGRLGHFGPAPISSDGVTARLSDELDELAGALDGSHRHQDFAADVLLESTQVLYWATPNRPARREILGRGSPGPRAGDPGRGNDGRTWSPSSSAQRSDLAFRRPKIRASCDESPCHPRTCRSGGGNWWAYGAGCRLQGSKRP